MDDGFEVAFFGCDEGEALFKVETHLTAKDGACARSGAVFFNGAVFEDVAHEVEIFLFHVSFFLFLFNVLVHIMGLNIPVCQRCG